MNQTPVPNPPSVHHLHVPTSRKINAETFKPLPAPMIVLCLQDLGLAAPLSSKKYLHMSPRKKLQIASTKTIILEIIEH